MGAIKGANPKTGFQCNFQPIVGLILFIVGAVIGADGAERFWATPLFGTASLAV